MSPSDINDLTVEIVDYREHGEELRAVRFAVFVDEQQIDPALEIDGRDPDCIHCLVKHNDRPIATGRMELDGHIGRLAVLAEYRGRGIGGLVLKALIQHGLDNGITEFHLHSQYYAKGFYERFGFVEEGEVFMEAGIEHIMMSKRHAPKP